MKVFEERMRRKKEEEEKKRRESRGMKDVIKVCRER